MVWVGALSYSIYLWHWPVIILGGWVADAFGATLPAWGLVLLALGLGACPPGCPGGSSSPRSTTAPGCATGPRALLAAGLALSCVGVLAALPLLALRSPFTTTPPGGALPPLSQLGAATLQPGQPFTAGRRPRLGHPRPAGVRAGPAEGRRRPLPGAVDATAPVACTFGDPQGATTVALVGDSKAMQWLPALEEAAATRGWRVVTYGKSSCAFSDAPAAQAGAAYPQCDAWNARGHGRPARRPARRRRHLRAWPRAPGPAAAPRASPLVDGYASRWTTLADAGVPVVVVGDSPRLARRPRRLRRPAPDAS